VRVEKGKEKSQTLVLLKAFSTIPGRTSSVDASQSQGFSLSYLISDTTVAIPPECATLEIASDPKGRDGKQ
jgi:hypothetical protein